MNSIQQKQGAPAKKSRLLSRINGIQHAYFTRHGGVSEGVYDSLNCSPGSDDNPQKVMTNRAIALESLGLENTTLFGLNQIHSTRVHVIDEIGQLPDQHIFQEGDALVTCRKQVALSVLGADCAPLLFAATNKPVIAAAHAGWKGAVSGMVAEVVSAMCELGADPADIAVCIGPTIHQESYEVQHDFIVELERLSSFDPSRYLREQSGRFFFNLPGYLEKQCSLSGIGQIENIGLDTYARDEFFSYRRNTQAGEKEYGRQISMIALV